MSMASDLRQKALTVQRVTDENCARDLCKELAEAAGSGLFCYIFDYCLRSGVAEILQSEPYGFTVEVGNSTTIISW